MVIAASLMAQLKAILIMETIDFPSQLTLIVRHNASKDVLMETSIYEIVVMKRDSSR